MGLERVLCAGLYYCGLNSAFRFFLKRNQCLVLMYHRVVDPTGLDDLDAGFLDPGMYVTTQAFEMQMEYIARHYQVIDVARLARAVKNGEKLAKYSCVITFDDGWRDTYTCAFPILKKYNLPATIFLVSDYVGTNDWFWWEKVSRLLSRYLASQASAEILAAAGPTMRGTGLCSLLSDPGLSTPARVSRVLEAMKALTPSDIDRVIHELEEALRGHHVEFNYSARVTLNWEEVVEMGRARITVGAHTKTHPILTKISTREAAEEIAESKMAIQKRLGTACSSFCYPNGEYDEHVKEQVMAHYECAFTTRQELVRLHDDPFALKRIGIRHATSRTRAQFACRASGLVALLLSAIRKICKFS